MSDRNLHILASPAFLISLVLLLLNDFVFKPQFHNGLTGKLSDFAGLFAFSLFWTAFFPRRKTFICVSTALLFVFWKSTYSHSAIDGWNSLPFFDIARTVDYGDLWALLVLPLAYLYVDISPEVHIPRRLVYAIVVVSVFAFTATQSSQQHSYNTQYQFPISKKELLKRITRLLDNGEKDSFENAETIQVRFDDCGDIAMANVQEKGNESVIVLTEMYNRCPGKVEADVLRQLFEKEFINKLREEPVGKSTVIQTIRTISP